MITEFEMTRGNMPTGPNAADVALEASVTHDRATAMIAASWAMTEAYTGRIYWTATDATAVAVLEAESDLQWPRYPFPASLTAESWDGSTWASASVEYVPDAGTLIGLALGRYRLTGGSVDPGTPASHVIEAVRALALYQLIHSPTRREFRTVTAADSTVTREALAGLFKASGAGILLASEVRW